MGKKSKNKKSGIVYSTNPDFGKKNDFFGDLNFDEPEEASDPNKAQQRIRVFLDKKKRKGKAATLIVGLECTDNELNAMGKKLKAMCGVGGSVKDGEILLQGDQRDKAIDWLIQQGYKDVKKSGG